MKKDLGIKPYLFPMHVSMISTCSEDGTVDVMKDFYQKTAKRFPTPVIM